MILAGAALAFFLTAPTFAEPADGPLTYPKARRTDYTELIHGKNVADPYRWMENIDSPETKAWIKAENEVTEKYMSKLPERKAIRARLDQLSNYEKYGCPWKEGGRWFYFHNSGLQNQSVLYTMNSLDGSPRALLDPNTFTKDGTAALSSIAVSPDGKYLAYGVADAGSDWNTWHVLDIETGKKLPDKLEWIKFSDASWDKEGKGFYYSRYPAPTPGENLKAANRFHVLYYHKVGTLQADDKIVFGFPDNPDMFVQGSVSDDGKWLIINAENPANGNTATIVRDLTAPGEKYTDIPGAFSSKTYPIEVCNDKLLLFSNQNAPNYRVLSCDLSKGSNLSVKEFIPESKNSLESVSQVGNSVFAFYLQDASTKVLHYDLDGKLLGEVPMPGIGSASGFKGKQADTETFFRFTSYTRPPSVYKYDLASREVTLWKQPKLTFDPDKYETTQVFFESKDGTKIPMFLSKRKDLEPNGELPVLMYGYGGFSISLTPGFSVTGVSWMEMGGVYAVVNLRGGNEYGEAWHKAGTKTRKQNVFDDFIAAGEWLIANKYTNPSKLAIMGGSNGGLLVGACLNQRPELFGAAIPQVGVMDMLRYQKFTIGSHWVGDYGDVANNAEFRTLFAISPYHNVQSEVPYPPTFITTADHDDRVFPAHSFKYAAAMQNAQSGPAPILVRINTRAGHGAGKPLSMRLDETADILAFIKHSLNMK